MVFGEQISHLLTGLVHGGGDDVAGRLLRQLDDVFAQVGLQDLKTRRFQGGVQRRFLADHGFALGDVGAARLPAKLHDDLFGLLGRLGPMHLTAGGEHRLFILPQQFRQMVEGVGLYGGGPFAQLGEFGHGRHGLGAFAYEARPGAGQGLLELPVLQGFAGVRQEGGGVVFHSAIPGPPVSPASNSAI